MSFLRSGARTATRLRATVSVLMLSIGLAALAPSPAAGDIADAAPVLDGFTSSAKALVPAQGSGAGAFCPRTTGEWWHDYAAVGCVQLLAGRDATAPLTDTELSWLELGDLPAYATVDLAAIDAALAAYEQRLAEEAAAAAEEATRSVSQRAPRQRPGQPYPTATIDRVLRACDYFDTTPRTMAEQEVYWSGVTACVEQSLPGYWQWKNSPRSAPERIEVDPEQEAYEACLEQLGSTDDIIDRAATRAYFDAHARCVDRRVPGYYARWASQEAKREAELEKALAREAAAYARLLERQERARQEIRDTCPHGGIASPTKSWASSYDEVDYIVTCYDGPTG
jgi:hypothetical protein